MNLVQPGGTIAAMWTMAWPPLVRDEDAVFADEEEVCWFKPRRANVTEQAANTELSRVSLPISLLRYLYLDYVYKPSLYP